MADKFRPFYWRLRKGWFLNGVDAEGAKTRIKLADTKDKAFDAGKEMLRRAAASASRDPLFAEVAANWLGFKNDAQLNVRFHPHGSHA